MKPDIVRIDDEWEQWSMGDLIDNLGKWLKRNKPEEIDTVTIPTKKEKHCISKGDGGASAANPITRGPLFYFL